MMLKICGLVFLFSLISCRTAETSSLLGSQNTQEFSCKVVKLVDDNFFDEGLEQFPDGDSDKSSVIVRYVSKSPKLLVGGFTFPRGTGGIKLTNSSTKAIIDVSDTSFKSFFFVHDSSDGKAYLMNGDSGAMKDAKEIAWLNCHHHQGIDPFAGGSGISSAKKATAMTGLDCKFSTSGGGSFTVRGKDNGLIDSNAFRRDGLIQRRAPRIKYDVTSVESNSRSIHIKAKVASGQTLHTNSGGDTVDFDKIEVKIDKNSPSLSTAKFKVGGSEFNPMGFDCSDSDFDAIR